MNTYLIIDTAIITTNKQRVSSYGYYHNEYTMANRYGYSPLTSTYMVIVTAITINGYTMVMDTAITANEYIPLRQD
jgi:hypothetical protein